MGIAIVHDAPTGIYRVRGGNVADDKPIDAGAADDPRSVTLYAVLRRARADRRATRRRPSAARPAESDPEPIGGQSGRTLSAGRLGRWRRPIHARALMCRATSSTGGLRASVHHLPTKVTMPTSACA